MYDFYGATPRPTTKLAATRLSLKGLSDCSKNSRVWIAVRIFRVRIIALLAVWLTVGRFPRRSEALHVGSPSFIGYCKNAKNGYHFVKKFRRSLFPSSHLSYWLLQVDEEFFLSPSSIQTFKKSESSNVRSQKWKWLSNQILYLNF